MTIQYNAGSGEARLAAPSDLESGGGDDRGREDKRPGAGRRPGKGIIDIGIDSGPGTSRREREDGRPIAPDGDAGDGSVDIGGGSKRKS